MAWEIYKGDTSVGYIQPDGNVFIHGAKVGYVTKGGDVYDRTMTKLGHVTDAGEVQDRSAGTVGSVGPEGDLYKATELSGFVADGDANATSGMTVFQAGAAALLLW